MLRKLQKKQKVCLHNRSTGVSSGINCEYNWNFKNITPKEFLSLSFSIIHRTTTDLKISFFLISQCHLQGYNQSMNLETQDPFPNKPSPTSQITRKYWKCFRSSSIVNFHIVSLEKWSHKLHFFPHLELFTRLSNFHFESYTSKLK